MDNIKYYKSFTDDFVESSNQEQKIPGNYKAYHTNVLYRAVSAVLYVIAIIFGWVYQKAVLHVKLVNKEVLRKEKNRGYFLYGNHTQPIGDVFGPAVYMTPKRMYAIASPANLGIPVIGKLLPMLGAIVTPSDMKGMKEMMNAIGTHVEKKRCIVVYPEAHVWPWCDFVRPFPSTSFRFPVELDAPSFAMTTTYQKREGGKKPEVTVYIDGPFYPDKTLSAKKAQKKLCEEIHEAMELRSRNSNAEYVRYLPEEAM